MTFSPLARSFRLFSLGMVFLLVEILSSPTSPVLAQEKPQPRTVHLDELDLSLAKSASKPAQRNLSVSGVPLSLNGRRFDRGVGLQAPASIRLLLPENVQRFHAFVGVDDAASNGSAPVEFFIEAGNMSLWKSGPVKRGDAPREVNLNIEKTRKYRGGIEEITLSVRPGSDTNDGVPVNWADAWFTCAGDPAPKTIAQPVTEPYLLTPPAPPQPRINGPRVYGARPGTPFLYAIPATGDRPMRFAAEGLPEGLTLHPETGHITGSTRKEGTHRVRLKASNTLGEAERELRIVIGDKICLTPPLGWNSWNCWAATVDDAKIRAAAQAMVKTGLAQHGWTYVNIDDGWQGKRDASTHALQGNEKFPDMAALCQSVHDLGLKVGLYSTPWVTSYAGYPGGSSDNADGAWSQEKEGRTPTGSPGWRHGKVSFASNDAQQWAAWGMDYLKYDWAPNDVAHTREMADALRASGRDLVYSLSNSAPFDLAADWAQLANGWRTTGDIEESWESLSKIAFAQAPWAPFAGPGHWNDSDIFVVGQIGWGNNLHPSKLTPDEQYAHVSLWCLNASPLLLGCDLEKLDAFTLNLLTNDEVLEVNQDPLGKPAQSKQQTGARLYIKEMEDGSKVIGLFNTTPVATEIAVTWSDLGLGAPQRVRDLWRQKNLSSTGPQFTSPVPSHGVLLIRVWTGVPESRADEKEHKV